MKKTLAFCIVVLINSMMTLPAHAERGHQYGHSRHWSAPLVVERHHRHDQWRRSHWIAPAAVLAITGAALGFGAYQHYNQPTPVTPPPARPYPPAQPADTWYFCGSSGQYYPYTQACPEGWQAVPAR